MARPDLHPDGFQDKEPHLRPPPIVCWMANDLFEERKDAKGKGTKECYVVENPTASWHTSLSFVTQ
eukprot:15458174-Alexandrium_andersonii.AAC.1